MPPSPIISVRGLGKRYRLGATLAHNTLRDHLAAAARSLFGAGRGTRGEGRGAGVECRVSSVEGGERNPPTPQSPPSPHSPNEFWALRDVSFDVHQGEVVGIIGRNGAGKSTLLKILSQITDPTEGEVRIRGRVASLLEVGTGFHPELSGRENIFLNGAILGMTRAEIRKKFDEIVDFSGVDKFIDTPVKRYSSGMYVRLAFAVAAHLEPEILVVDEVLAVGDMEFQKKCLGKMDQVAKKGRTVLFVSHNMPAITRLCGRTILLNKGSVAFDGLSHEAVRHYIASGSDCLARAEWEPDRMPGNEHVRLRFVQLVDPSDHPIDKVDITQEFGIQMGIEVLQDSKVLVPNLHIYTDDGIRAFAVADHSRDQCNALRSKGLQRCTVWIPGNWLNEGTYFLEAAVSTMNPVQVHFDERDVIAIQVVENAEAPSATRGRYGGKFPGVFRPLLRWTTQAG